MPQPRPPPIVSPQKWEAREKLLVKEKELTRAPDAALLADPPVSCSSGCPATSSLGRVPIPQRD